MGFICNHTEKVVDTIIVELDEGKLFVDVESIEIDLGKDWIVKDW